MSSCLSILTPYLTNVVRLEKVRTLASCSIGRQDDDVGALRLVCCYTTRHCYLCYAKPDSHFQIGYDITVPIHIPSPIMELGGIATAACMISGPAVAAVSDVNFQSTHRPRLRV